MENLSTTVHCRHCDLHDFQMKKGVICTLTGEKGAFYGACTKAKFDLNLRKKIFEIEGRHAVLKYLKKRTYLQFYGLLILGVLIFILNYFVTIMIFERGFVSTITITIFILALIVIGKGIASLKSYLTKRNINRPKKEQLNALMKLYLAQYEMTASFMSKSTLSLLRSLNVAQAISAFLASKALFYTMN